MVITYLILLILIISGAYYLCFRSIQCDHNYILIKRFGWDNLKRYRGGEVFCFECTRCGDRKHTGHFNQLDPSLQRAIQLWKDRKLEDISHIVSSEVDFD
jgi:hypothetical protein